MEKFLLSCFYWLLTFTAVASTMSYVRLGRKVQWTKLFLLIKATILRLAPKLHSCCCYCQLYLLCTDSLGLSSVSNEQKKNWNKKLWKGKISSLFLFYFILFFSHPFRIITVCAIHLIRYCWTFKSRGWGEDE